MTIDLLENVDPADVLTYARAVPEPAEYLLTREIVPNTTIESVKYRIHNSEKRTNVAKFRAFDAEAPLGRREAQHQTLEGKLPPVGDKVYIGELEQILLDITRGTDDQELVDLVYNDVETRVLAIRARMELAAGDLITDRKFELLDENNLTLEADFGFEFDGTPLGAEWSPVPSVLWGAANATPLTDEQLWIQFLRDEGDGEPGDAMTSAQVRALLGRNHEYQEAYFGRGQSTYPALNPGQVDSVRSAAGLPAIRLYDAKVRVDGVNQRVTPANRFFLLPADKSTFAQTQYGITAESIMMSRQGNPRIEREDLPGIVVTARSEDDPPKVWTRGNAVAMPVMYSPKAYMPARVI
jgi:hypothetical protein